MRWEVKLQKVNGEFEIDFPGEMITRLGLRDGDTLSIEEVEGGVMLRRVDPNFARAMEAYEVGARKYGNALRALADF